MAISHALILGIIQGATEFLPVSSSGHLIFIPELLGWPDQGISFDVIVHLGTLCAVGYYFRDELIRLIKAVFSPSVSTRDDRRFAWLLVAATIPAALVAALAGGRIESFFREALYVGLATIVWGIVLWFADRYARHHANRRLEDLTLRNAVFVGVAQVLALIPGTSRSGITMTAGMFSGFEKRSAAELSFLMSVPIIMLAGADGIRDLIVYGPNGVGAVALIVGFIASACAGLIAIWGLMGIIKRWSFTPFVVYRLIVGALILTLLV